MDFRDVIIARLKHTGCSRYLFAKRMELDGISAQTVYKYLSGRTETTTKVLQTMLAELGITIIINSGSAVLKTDWSISLKAKWLSEIAKKKAPGNTPGA